MSDSACGMTKGAPGIASGPPETVEIVTVSPESIVKSGGSFASK